MDSERVVVQAPMSFTGSTRRIWRLTDTNVWVKWLVAIPAALILIPLAWVVVACWYLVFGLFLAPYRLLRRGSRRRKQERLRHRELLEARTTDK